MGAATALGKFRRNLELGKAKERSKKKAVDSFRRIRRKCRRFEAHGFACPEPHSGGSRFQFISVCVFSKFGTMG